MNHQESNLQKGCVTAFRLQYPQYLLFAVPNGGYRNEREAKTLKAEGVTSGVADLQLTVAKQGYHGLFLETKIKTLVGVKKNGEPRYNLTYQTIEQKAFQKTVEQQGYKYVVYRTVDEFWDVVNAYLK